MQDIKLLKFISGKMFLSLTYTEGRPGCSMYIHDLKSPFNNNADLYQLRRFLLLGTFELQIFKLQTACWLLDKLPHL